MVNLLQAGATWQAARLAEIAAVSVTLRRTGETDVTVSATPGRTPLEVDNGDGTSLRFESRDYLIEAADYAFAGTVTEPAEGDLILETISGVTRTYAVLPIPGESCWRYCDQNRVLIRVHTKLYEQT